VSFASRYLLRVIDGHLLRVIIGYLLRVIDGHLLGKPNDY